MLFGGYTEIIYNTNITTVYITASYFNDVLCFNKYGFIAFILPERIEIRKTEITLRPQAYKIKRK